MNATAILRTALWLTAVWNIGAAAAFVAPERLGAVLGLPGGSSRFYTLLLAYVIGVFGVVYAWLARRPHIDVPLLVVAAAGKWGVLAIALICYVNGELDLRALVPAAVDGIFGAVFVWWLLTAGRTPPAATA